MKHLLAHALVLSLFLPGCTHPCDDAPASTSHLCWAEDLVENVPPERNVYGGDPTIMHWAWVDGSTQYRNQSRTAGFVSGALEQAGRMNDEVLLALGSYTPLASSYYEAILAGDVFTMRSSVDEIAAGDIIAIRFMGGQGDSGQVAIARGPVRKGRGGVLCGADSAVLNEMDQYVLDVVDSAVVPHGNADTRAPYKNGAGFGTLRLFADNKSIAGYSWSSTDSTCWPPTTRRLVVGQLHP